MPYVQVDIDLEEFDTDELCDEIINRINKGTRDHDKVKLDLLKSNLIDLFKEMNGLVLPYKSLWDRQKIQFLASIWDDYSPQEMEDKLKK